MVEKLAGNAVAGSVGDCHLGGIHDYNEMGEGGGAGETTGGA